MDVSVIVRFHNEERYLPAVMDALASQVFPGHTFEIIGVDNRSEDSSRAIVSRHTSNILTIDDYQPGKALNRAIESARGRCIAVLSAHTIPANRTWLAKLYPHVEHSRVAGVYGAQLYPIDSKFLDKRDLDIFSRNQPRTERQDSDFWNANSMFQREVWARQPFDETIFELEDHYWTKLVLPLGYEIHFEPRALVYHYGHIARNDREYLSASNLTPSQRVDQAISVLDDPSAAWPATMVAGLTIASLTHLEDCRRAVPALGRILHTHWDFDVRWRVAGALGKIHCDQSVSLLIPALADSSFYARDEAAWSLARLGKIAVDPLTRALAGLADDAIPFAALALGLSGDMQGEQRAVQLLLEELRSGDIDRVRNAVYFAGEVPRASGAPALVSCITACLDHTDPWLVAVSSWAWGCFAAERPSELDPSKILRLARQHPDELVRFEAVVALGKWLRASGSGDAAPLLAVLGNEPMGRVRYGAAQSLRHLMQHAQISPQLSECTEDEDFGVHYELGLIDQMRGRSGGECHKN